MRAVILPTPRGQELIVMNRESTFDAPKKQPKRWLVTFGDQKFFLSMIRLCRSSRRFGIDNFRYWNPKLLPLAFRKKYHAILRHKRGAGYWIWKPYIILQTLEEAKQGDIVVYSDAGIEIVDSLAPLYDIAQRDKIVLFSAAPYQQKHYTKRDAFAMFDSDTSEYHESFQGMGGFMVLLCCAETKEFIMEWLNMMSEREGLAITDGANVSGKENVAGFVEHRHDQSVLSILAVKRKIKFHRDPSQWGWKSPLQPKSSYGQLINVHRQRARSLKRDLLHFLPIRLVIPLVWRLAGFRKEGNYNSK